MSYILKALIALSIIAFVIAVLGFIWLIGRLKINWPAWLKWVPPYAIGSLASFWLIERVIAFFQGDGKDISVLRTSSTLCDYCL